MSLKYPTQSNMMCKKPLIYCASLVVCSLTVEYKMWWSEISSSTDKSRQLSCQWSIKYVSISFSTPHPLEMDCITILENTENAPSCFPLLRRSATIRLFLTKHKARLQISESDGLQLPLSPQSVPLKGMCLKQLFTKSSIVLSSTATLLTLLESKAIKQHSNLVKLAFV